MAMRQASIVACREDPIMNDPIFHASDYAKAFETVLNEGNVERILQLYDTDVVMRSPDGRISTGMEAVRTEMQSLVDANARIGNDLRQVLVHGDTALIIVDWTLQLTLPHGKAVHQHGTATNVIRTDKTSGWRMIVANPYGIA
jgi:ketosteroid isomerase-like protein